MLSKIGKAVLPYCIAALGLVLCMVLVFCLGDAHGERRAADAHAKYVKDQADKVVEVAASQIQVVEKTEIKYRDRIQTIYLKGENVEQSVPIYVTAHDSDRYAVNAGFVRLYDAGWTNELPGPAIDADREPAGISLAAIAEVQAANATACLAWREQALGLREFYQQLRAVTADGEP